MAKSSPPRQISRPKRRGGVSGEPQTVPTDQVIWAPPVGIPLAVVPDPGAISVFERAMAALQRHEYRKALAEFEALQQRFPTESALLDRARGYAALCQRELSRSSHAAPQTTEERLTAATAALNNGEDQRAEQLIAQVLAEAPRHELGHYLLAVVHARRGAVAAALDALRQAIAVSPEVRAQARHDADFESLRGHDTFERMMSDTSAQSGIRRGS
jgi:predicted Zn-dependent protease